MSPAQDGSSNCHSLTKGLAELDKHNLAGSSRQSSRRTWSVRHMPIISESFPQQSEPIPVRSVTERNILRLIFLTTLENCLCT